VQKPYSRWIEILYGPFFKVIGFFYRTYTTNRARIAKLKANEKVSSFIKFMTMVILLGWILIWYFASDESRTSLVDDVKQSIGVTDSPPTQ
jgi:Fe2+ transport system protein B